MCVCLVVCECKSTVYAFQYMCTFSLGTAGLCVCVGVYFSMYSCACVCVYVLYVRGERERECVRESE